MKDRQEPRSIRPPQLEANTRASNDGLSQVRTSLSAGLPGGCEELIRLLASFTEQCATLDCLEDIPDHAAKKQSLRRRVSKLRLGYLRLMTKLTNTAAMNEADVAAKRLALAAYLDHGGQEETPGSRLTQSLLQDMARLDHS